MKYLILVLACVFIHCTSGTTKDFETAAEKDEKLIESDQYQGSPAQILAHMLRKESGVLVTERNGQYQLRIRGLSNSINNPSPPLFVINGTSVGTSFMDAAELLAGAKIRRIKVLKDQQASFYGVRGAGGVVEIFTEN